MTMRYSDDDGYGIGWLNDDTSPCVYKHQDEQTEEHSAIKRRLREYAGVSNLVREDE